LFRHSYVQALPPHDAASEFHLGASSEAHADIRAMVIGALFVASSFSDERCVSVFRACGSHMAVTRAEIQMPRFDTADVQGWDLLLAGAIWFVRKRETLRVQCLDRLALTRMIGSCRDLESDEQIKLNMFNLVFIWMSLVHVGFAVKRVGYTSA